MIIPIFDHKKIYNRRQYLRTLKNSHLITLGILLCLSFLATSCAPPGTLQPTYTPPPSRTPIKLGPTSTISPVPPTAVPPIPSPTLIPIPPLSYDDWTRGPEDAAFTFVVYSDFQ
jgi:hypothetical protein